FNSESNASLMKMFEKKVQGFIDEVENNHMVWLQEIQEEAAKMFCRYVCLLITFISLFCAFNFTNFLVTGKVFNIFICCRLSRTRRSTVRRSSVKVSSLNLINEELQKEPLKVEDLDVASVASMASLDTTRSGVSVDQGSESENSSENSKSRKESRGTFKSARKSHRPSGRRSIAGHRSLLSIRESLTRESMRRASRRSVHKKAMKPHLKSFLHTVQKNQLLMSTPNSLGRSTIVKSFIKRTTPLKVDIKEKERQRLEMLKKKEDQETERKKKMEEEKKRKLEEVKRKREERLKKVTEAREREEQKEEAKKRKIEQKFAQMEEKNDKVSLVFSTYEKLLVWLLIKEEEERKHQEFLQKKREEEEQERLKKMAEVKRLKQVEQERQLAAEKELQRKREQERIRIERYSVHEQENSAPNRVLISSLKFILLDACRVAYLKYTLVLRKYCKYILKSPQSYEMTPKGSNKTTARLDPENYGMDLNSDDSTDDESAPRKPIPSWAEGRKLNQAIMHHYYNPPDTDKRYGKIEPPNLEEIFSKSKPRYLKRTSSAVWNSPPMRSVRLHQH
uniref:Inner centromere protein n=1 Tax=Erpetoichthys calabaricus TaxID=27687 RepID=A0A8C4X668_ERPCA